MIRRDVRLGATVELGAEHRLFSVMGTRVSNQFRMHDSRPDGDRFLFVTFPTAAESPTEPVVEGIGPFVVVVNWFEELEQRMSN